MIRVTSPSNYYLVDNLAYTEDHILVKKLHIYNLERCWGVPELLAHFKLFGPVVHVKLFDKNTQGSYTLATKSKSAFVEFQGAEAAARALLSSNQFQNITFSVECYDSWKQPDYLKKQVDMAAGGESNDVNVGAEDGESDYKLKYLYRINADCLQMVLRNMCMTDQLRFARSSERFASIYKEKARIRYKSVQFEMFGSMTVWDLRTFFMLGGDYVIKMDGYLAPGHSHRLCEFAGKHCVNVRTISVRASMLSAHHVYSLLANTLKLSELQLLDCCLLNSCFETMSHLHKLRVLDISHNDLITGVNITKLPGSIESLTMNGCTRIESQYIVDLCREHKQLKELHVSSLSTKDLLPMMSMSPALESLTLSGRRSEWPNERIVAHMPSLNRIVVHLGPTVSRLEPKLLHWLVEHKANQLVRFETEGFGIAGREMLNNIGKLVALRILNLSDIDPYNYGATLHAFHNLRQLQEVRLNRSGLVSNGAIMALLCACKNLYKLYLEECSGLTEELLPAISRTFANNGSKGDTGRKLPIYLHLYGTQISSEFVENQEANAKGIYVASIKPTLPPEMWFVDLYNLSYDYDYDDPDADDLD